MILNKNVSMRYVKMLEWNGSSARKYVSRL